MRRAPLFLTSVTAAFIVLFIVSPAASQLVGCDAEGIDCSIDSDGGTGVCQERLLEDGLGIVSFETNLTTDGPFTWTLTQSEEVSLNLPYTNRQFWLGMPPSLNTSDIDGVAGCAMVMTNLTNVLQPPPDSDFSNFGCGTVMGDDCAADIFSIIQQELSSIVRNGTANPCQVLNEQIEDLQIPFPQSCQSQFQVPDYFVFGNVAELFDQSDLGFQSQDGCVATTGGPDYIMNYGPRTTTFMKGYDDPALFASGTTPVVTLFHNDPFNATGSDLFFAEPELHLHCLTVVSPDETSSPTSASARTTASSTTALFAILISLFSMAWVGVAL
ncbi:hypothetical protein DV738_g189, partial [Chaetothyriales sp. CBS 135597]